jgi:hypothetical protein
LRNPYTLAYLDSSDDQRLLRKARRSGEIALLDEIFVTEKKMDADDDRRIEFYFQDSIHFGKFSLATVASCYTAEELERQVISESGRSRPAGNLRVQPN